MLKKDEQMKTEERSQLRGCERTGERLEKKVGMSHRKNIKKGRGESKRAGRKRRQLPE